jgi:hypothetical protein
MEFEQELEYGQDDEEGTEQYPTEEEDYNWPPHFCQGCGFAILDCVCDHDDECPTCAATLQIAPAPWNGESGAKNEGYVATTGCESHEPR